MTQRAGRRSNPGSPHPRHEGSSKLTSLSLIPHNFTSAEEYLQPLKGLSEAMQANTSLARSGRLIMGKPLPHYHLHHAHHHCSPQSGPSGPEPSRSEAGASLRCCCNYPLSASHYRALSPARRCAKCSMCNISGNITLRLMCASDKSESKQN